MLLIVIQFWIYITFLKLLCQFWRIYYVKVSLKTNSYTYVWFLLFQRRVVKVNTVLSHLEHEGPYEWCLISKQSRSWVLVLWWMFLLRSKRNLWRPILFFLHKNFNSKTLYFLNHISFKTNSSLYAKFRENQPFA